MPNIQSTIRKKLDRLDTVPDELFGKVEKAEKELLKETLDLLNQLSTDSQGKIKINQKNQILIDRIIKRLNKTLFRGQYLEAVKGFSKEFPEQLSINEDIFKNIFPAFTDKELFTNVMKGGQRRAIDRLSEGAIAENFLIPLKNIMNNSMAVKSSIPDLASQLTIEITGTKEADGKLLNWVKQTAKDTFAISDRETTKIISDDLGVRFWRYVGGLVEDSRCFCVKRNRKTFSEVQVDYWGTEPSLWNKTGDCKKGGGMIKGTNSSTIWSFLGGYNCNHALIPVDENSVSDEVLANEDNPKYIPE